MNKYTFLIVLISVLWSCSNAPDSKQPENSKTQAEAKTDVQPKAKDQAKTILFFGNSLTAAYGLEKEQGYPALIEQKLKEKDLNYKVINAGLSGETTAGGLTRVDWILKQPVDVFVLELGGNDGLRGIDPAKSEQNLRNILKKVKATYPNCQLVLAGMEAPPNMGKKFTSEFRNIFKTVAQTENAVLIPFLLDGVAGDPKLNLADGIHPTAEGYKIVAENVWKVLLPILK